MFSVIFASLVLLQSVRTEFLNSQRSPLHSDDYQHFKDTRLKKIPDDSDEPNNKAVTIHCRSKRYSDKALLGATAFQAVFEVYKVAVGCKWTTPDLEKHLEEAKTKTKKAQDERDKTNLEWVPIHSAERYFQLLGTEMVILNEQIGKSGAIRKDIISLLDPPFFERAENQSVALKNMLRKMNSTQLEDPSTLEEEMKPAGNPTLGILGALAPLAQSFSMSGKNNDKHVTKAVVKQETKTFVKKNKKAIDSKLRSSRSSKRTARKWNRYSKPTSRSTYSSLKDTGTAQKTSKWSKAGKAFGHTITGIVAGIQVVTTIMGIIEFDKKCRAKDEKALGMINEADKMIENIEQINKNMTDYKEDIFELYGQLYGNLTNEELDDWVTREYEATIHMENQTPLLVDRARWIKEYQDGIKNQKKDDGSFEFAKIHNLLVNMNKALQSLVIDLDCDAKRIKIVESLRGDCAKGKANIESLWPTALKMEGATAKECITKKNAFSQNGVLKTVANLMVKDKRSKNCILNSEKKIKQVCKLWYENNAESTILALTEHVTKEDLKIMVTMCPPQSLGAEAKKSICLNKPVDGKKAMEKYNRFDKTEVLKAFDDCKLTSQQISNICSLKAKQKTLDDVTNLAPFNIYKDTKDAFESCLPDKTIVCRLKMVIRPGVTVEMIFSNEIKIYGKAAVLKVLNSCDVGYSYQAPIPKNVKSICRDAGMSFSYALIQHKISDEELESLQPICNVLRY